MESQLYQKREAYAVKIRRRDFELLQKERRMEFIAKYNPEYAPYEITEWIELVNQFMNTPIQGCTSILKQLKSSSRIETVTNFDHTTDFLLKLQEFMKEKYDLKEEQSLAVWVLSHLSYSKKTCITIVHDTQLVLELTRRFRVFGDLEVKDNCLWILNHAQREAPEITVYLIQNNIIDDILNFFREDPSTNQILEALRMTLYLIHEKVKDDYRYFKKLTVWLLQFCSLEDELPLMCFSTTILSMLSQLEYGEMVLIEIRKWKFLKRIAVGVLSIRAITDPVISMFLVAFVNICRKYFTNDQYHQELLTHIDIVRVLRKAISLDGMNDSVMFQILEAVTGFSEDARFYKKIVKDELFAHILHFHLHSQGAIHIASIKPVVTLILAITELNEYCLNLLKTYNKLTTDMTFLNQQLGSSTQEGNQLIEQIDLAMNHLDRFYQNKG